jgi:hypothetical protein
MSEVSSHEQERIECELRFGESEIDWLIRMLEFHRDSHKWFIENPQDNKYVGNADFHKMVVDRYERMIMIVRQIDSDSAKPFLKDRLYETPH